MPRPVPKRQGASSMNSIGLCKLVTKILEVNYFNKDIPDCKSNHKGNVDGEIEKSTWLRHQLFEITST